MTNRKIYKETATICILELGKQLKEFKQTIDNKNGDKKKLTMP